jgi:hypothetical protein
MIANRTRGFLGLAVCALLMSCVGCSSTGPVAPTGPTGPAPTGANVATVSINGGPTGDYQNGAFTSVTVCVPGSTTQCQTIGGILVDTGSYGLRILSQALTLTLPQQNDNSGNPILECAQFGSGFAWGPVQTADFSIASEAASSLPIQVIGTATYPAPDACSDDGSLPAIDSQTALGANGILGIGVFAQDCGNGCTLSGASNTGFYYSCPSATTCAITEEAIASQVVNPIVGFTTDNNGVIVEIPGLSGEALDATGYLVFGIGTESNNGLGSATVYGVDPNSGNFTSVFNNQAYTSFIDLGSEVVFALDPNTIGVGECSDVDLYCPTPTFTFTATNEGTNLAQSTVNFSIGNADTLLSSSDNAINGLAGPFPDTIDWGLPFFYGLNIYTAIDGQTTPAGDGPYWAY